MTTKGIAGLHEVEKHLQLGPTIAPAAAGLIGVDHAAVGCLEGRALDGEVLVEGTDASVAVDGVVAWIVCSFISVGGYAERTS